MTIAVGRLEKLYAVAESTYGTAVQPAATNAVRFKSFSASQGIERAPRDDKRTTRSLLEQITRRKTVEWSLESYLLPSGAAGTAPDGHDDLLESAFGTETVNAGTSVVYTLSREFTKPLSLHHCLGASITSPDDRIAAETIRGAVVDQVTFNLSGADEAMVSYQGFGKDILRAGISAVVSFTGNTITVTSGDGPKFDAGMVLRVGSVDNISITSVSGDVLTTSSTSGIANGNAITPQIIQTSQTFTSTASPISGILGSFTIDAVSFPIVSAQIVLSNGSKAHNDQYGSDSVVSYNLGNRRVTGSITYRLTDANFLELAKTKSFGSRALSLVSGTVAGSIATFAVPVAKFEYAPLVVNSLDDILVTQAFTALGSSGEDELSLTLT